MRRPSFSQCLQRRQRLLSLQVAEYLDWRLENRNPVTLFGAAAMAFTAAPALGQAVSMHANGGGIDGMAGATDLGVGRMRTGGAAAGRARIGAMDLDAIAMRPGRAAAVVGATAGEGTTVTARPAPTPDVAGDGPKLSILADTGQAGTGSGPSARWKPARALGSGGGALPSRGGSGSGASAVTAAAIQGRAARPRPPGTPAAPATIPGVMGGSPAPSGVSGPAAPVITRNAAAQGLQAGPVATSSTEAGTSIALGGDSGGVSRSAAMGPDTIRENASSLPTTGGGGMETLSFPYFPLYTLDQNDGVVLFDGQSQLASTYGTTDLYAQVKDASVSSYTWTLSGGYTFSYSGTSTDHLQIQWEWMNSSGSDQTETVTLTVTDSNSHQESQTYDFVIPASGLFSMPVSSSWPVTIPPDLVATGAPTIASQNASVDANSGALDTSINLSAYNPNVPALALTYDSLAADPKPIIVVHHTLDASSGVPTTVAATLTFNGTARDDLVLRHQQLRPRRRAADGPPGRCHRSEHGPLRLLACRWLTNTVDAPRPPRTAGRRRC